MRASPAWTVGITGSVLIDISRAWLCLAVLPGSVSACQGFQPGRVRIRYIFCDDDELQCVWLACLPIYLLAGLLAGLLGCLVSWTLRTRLVVVTSTSNTTNCPN